MLTCASKVSVYALSLLTFFSLSKTLVPQTHFLCVLEGLVRQQCDLAPSHSPANQTFSHASRRYSARTHLYRANNVTTVHRHLLISIHGNFACHNNPQNAINCSLYQGATFSNLMKIQLQLSNAATTVTTWPPCLALWTGPVSQMTYHWAYHVSNSLQGEISADFRSRFTKHLHVVMWSHFVQLAVPVYFP